MQLSLSSLLCPYLFKVHRCSSAFSALFGMESSVWRTELGLNMTRVFLVSVLLVASSSSWAASMSQQYQQLRSQANLVSAKALLYFDTDPRSGGTPEKDELQVLDQACTNLHTQALSVGLSSPHLQGMLDSVEALKKLSPQQAMDYASLLIVLLDHHEHLEEQLATLYRSYTVSPLAQAMNNQSQRVAVLRLNVLVRNARVLGRHTLSQNDNTFIQFDRDIEQGFEALASMLPELDQPELLRKRQTYRFIRKQLLIPDTLRKSVAADRYVNGLIDWLDEKATTSDTQARQAGTL